MTDMERAIYVVIARKSRCPRFSEMVRGDTVVAEAASLIGRSADTGCWTVLSQIEDQVRSTHPGEPELCEEAEVRRNSGFGGTDAGRAKTNARKALKSDDTLVGSWLDRTHPCGLTVLVKQRSSFETFWVCTDGSVSRNDEFPNRLVSMKPPGGAKRAWQSPGLKMRTTTVLGSRTVEWIDSSGKRFDYRRLVELEDGSLLFYESGVGSHTEAPLAEAHRGRPFPLD